MQIYLTNTPVTWRDRHESGPFRVQDVVDSLRKMYFEKKEITVKTSEQDYENMAISSIGLPKKIATGTSKLIPITLQQIMVTESRIGAIPASYGKSGSTGTNAGTAGTNARPNPGQGTQGVQNAQSGNRGSILYNASSSAGLLPRGSQAAIDGFFANLNL